MDKQPFIYTLPEQFLADSTVPLHWKLYSLINGFWIAGKPVFASNKFFAQKLNCSERYIRECLEKLEEMGVLLRTGKSQNRTIIPGGGTSSSGQGGTSSSVREEPVVPHISDSISDSESIAKAKEEIFQEEGIGFKKADGSGEIISAFREFNPLLGNRKSYADSSRRMIAAYGLETVLNVVHSLPEINKIPYITKATTPTDLELNWVKIQSQLKSQEGVKRTTKPHII